MYNKANLNHSGPISRGSAATPAEEVVSVWFFPGVLLTRF